MYGDDEELIFWWIYDTDFGREDPTIEYDGKEYLIKTAEQLYFVVNGVWEEEWEV